MELCEKHKVSLNVYQRAFFVDINYVILPKEINVYTYLNYKWSKNNLKTEIFKKCSSFLILKE